MRCRMSLMGLVSRVTPVHTAMRNCMRDEGGPFGIGNQVLISSHRKLLWSKAMVVSVAGKPEQDSAGKIERGERKQTASEVSKSDWTMPKSGADPSSEISLGDA